MKKYRGLIAATFTPTHEDDSIAPELIGPMVEYAVSRKLDGLFAVGTTGEFPSLTHAERRMVAEEYIRMAAGRIPVIVNVGSCSVREAVELTEHAAACGADAICAMAPFYFRPDSPRALVECLKPLVPACSGRPLYLYHCPSKTGVNLPMVEFLEIAAEELPNFAGIKFTHVDLFEYKRCVDFSGRFQIFYGCDEMLLGALAMGAEAGVGSTYNYLPRVYQGILDAFAAGEMERARELQAVSHRAVRLLVRYGMQAQKEFMRLAGVELGHIRLPSLRLTAEQRAGFLRGVEEAGLLPWIG